MAEHIEEYRSSQERMRLIEHYDSLGYRLEVEQNHFDGNSLIFTDDVEPVSIEAEIDALKARMEKLETKIRPL